jgi:hypothetical protein
MVNDSAPASRRLAAATLGGRHAQARVDDGQCVAVGRLPAPDVHRLVGRREHQRVLDELGQQVGQVGGGRAEDGGRLDAADVTRW